MDNSIQTEPVFTPIGSLTRQAATEGMVLLKNNENVLPLKSDDTVAIFGKGQINLIKGGTGSGDVKVAKVVNLLEGLEEKAAEGKVKIYEPLATKYKDSVSYDQNGNIVISYNPTDEDITAAAAATNTAIYVITRNSGEGGDRSSSDGDYKLSQEESRMINKLGRLGFSNIIVVLNIGGIIDTTTILSYPQVKSILLAGQPGQDGGLAIADILVGDVTPSGKLSDTYAKSFLDYPSSANFNESQDYVNYTEDIYVGYRYFETFDPNYDKVNFEFGFGLSYTTFEFSDVNIAVEDEKVNISVKVTNTGSYNGKEVVQVYYSAPQGKLGNPAKELAAFAKTTTLAPGKAEVVTMSFDIDDMASYDDNGKVQKSAYVMEAGDYNIYVGNSIRNAGQAGVRYTYKVEETKIVEQLTEQMAAKLLPERLLGDGSYENVYDESGIATELGDSLIRIEGEDYYTKHRHADDAFDSTGTKAVLKVNSSGDSNRYATYAVDVATAGDYTMKLGVGYVGNPIENAVSFYVNDKKQNGLTVNLTKGDNLWNPYETEGVTMHLDEGLNFIKVEFVDKIVVHLDYLTIAPAGFESTASAASAGAVSAAVASLPSTDAVSQPSAGKIMFDDLMEDPSLMEAFLDQLNVYQLIDLLHGRSGENEKTYSDTGIFGGLDDYKIPFVQTADGPAGIRMKDMNATAFPVETTLACSWNTELLYKVGEAMAEEAKKYDVDIWLSPAVNIHRNPLTGRNFEYYSEDPYLSGMMASAIINGVQDNGIGVMLKHFVANEKETNRVYSDTRVSERALREIYLTPFKIAIDNANPWIIMSSYNKVNGVYTAANKELLTNILRDEWGYEGLVSSDWWNTSVAYKELLAGESLKMKTIDSGNAQSILGAYTAGILTREDLEWNAQKVIEVVMKSEAAKAADKAAK